MRTTTVRAVPVIARRALSDLAGRSASDASVDPRTRAVAAIEWLCRAQDHGDDRGFSYGFTIKGGWQPSYVETTGYIIPTFLDAADRLHWPNLRTRAHDAGSWLVGMQLPDGSFPNPGLDPNAGVVFDTGQDLLGLLALAEALDDAAEASVFDQAARQAMSWLTTVADGEGRWTRNTFNGIPHVYNSRVAWAQAMAARRFGSDEAEAVARANLDWACSQQLDNGWFEQCAFTPGAPPFTHTTAYAGRGLLEAGRVLGEQRYLDAARGVAAAAARHLDDEGWLPGRIGTDDQAASHSMCLTGTAQFAIIWFELAAQDDNAEFRDLGLRAVSAVGRHQKLGGGDDTRGAIKGSAPIWGRYAPLGYPNWAAKFFVDALFRAHDAEGVVQTP